VTATTTDRTVRVFGTTFRNPVLLAAGTAGFGRELDRIVDLDALGGIVTKAVSPEPRGGNPAPRVAEFGGGMLNAVGLANPGLERVAAVDLPWLAQHLQRARVIVNVVGFVPGDYAAVVRRLDDADVVTAFELNVSCPNTDRGGEEFGADAEVLGDLVRRCRGATERPLVVKLSPTVPNTAAVAQAAAEAGADGFSLVNTIPGTLYRWEGRRREPAARLGYGKGGVSGPALLPVGVLATRIVAERTGLPVIGVGGIRTLEDVDQYIEAGASLVAIGTAGMADPRLPERVARAWERRG
jgi:dihydroorotate dehydrogenase (NAD+) catalytic subunit